ncbi:unnamed protein product [Urochloa humidicola]
MAGNGCSSGRGEACSPAVVLAAALRPRVHFWRRSRVRAAPPGHRPLQSSCLQLATPCGGYMATAGDLSDEERRAMPPSTLSPAQNLMMEKEAILKSVELSS